MYIHQLINGFEFNHHRPVDQEIESIGIIDYQILIQHGANEFLLKRDTPEGKFMSQRTLIRRLEQPRTKFTMNFNRRTDDSFCEFVLLHGLCVSSVPSVTKSEFGTALVPIVGGVVGVGDGEEVGFLEGLTDELQADGQTGGGKPGGHGDPRQAREVHPDGVDVG